MSEEQEQTAGEETAPVVNRKELLERVAAEAEVRKQIARPIVEATLAVLARALAEGEEINLQPLGNIKIKRTDDNENAHVIHARIRQSKSYGENLDSEVAEAFE
ncbi:integration host factor subunit alpha [Pseudoruegeria aquimaris]|uniref:Integration host factor subunit alpha n=1 Tax=Pseudoruegeria aquimaris TaxID=393663 RepID=A0A1Y5R8U8_9RHOB|nr:HU family DNA-binding protein [Pseudoruegeria aquimaris]SLN11818.1 integration host factor subunit alpha [Pseudoruegeria aquimaris]